MIARLTRRRPLVMATACYLTGAVLGSTAAVPAMWWALGLIAVSVVVWKKRGAAVFAALALLAAMVASFMLQAPDPIPTEGVSLTGEICLEPYANDERTVFTLSDAVLAGKRINRKVRVYVYDTIDAGPGDRVSMNVDTWQPSGQTNPDGFDFRYWCKARNLICATMKTGTAVVFPAEGLSFHTLLKTVRARLGAAIDESFPEEQTLLVRALLLGEQSGLPEEMSKDFTTAGVSHILSVSGLHVTCLAFFLDFLLRKLFSRKTVFVTMAGLLWFYAALVGFTGPIIRSVIMYMLVRLAPLIGRPADDLTGLSAACLLMLAVNPLQVRDGGFILSFSAMAGLILLDRPLEKAMGYHRAPRGLRTIVRALASSIAATLGIFPALLCLFGVFQPYGPLVNLAAVPLATAALPASFLAVLGVMISGTLGRIIAWPASVLYGWLIDVVKFAANLPFSTVVAGRMAWWLCVLWGIAVYAVSEHSGLSRRLRRGLSAFFPAAVACSVLLNAIAMPDGLTIDFLDAGSADTAVLYADRRVYAIDAGEKDGPLADYLAKTGSSLEAIFLSHPHSDHIGAAGKVRTLYPNAVIYVPECWNRVPGVLEAEEQAGLKDAPYVYLSAGDEVRLSEDVTARVLYPPEGLIPQDANAASMVLEVTNQAGAVLFTGDLEDAAAMTRIPDVDLLKAAHHGSDIDAAELLLRAATPGAVVISSGRNDDAHPSEAFLARIERLGLEAFETERWGMIRARIEKDGDVQISTFLSLKEEA